MKHDLLKKLDTDKIPQHVAIIMDGNGRWATKKGLPRNAGHRAGVKALEDIIKACVELEIKILSVFAFSTENWRRPEKEISVLMELLSYHLSRERNTLHNNGIKIRCIGNIAGLPIAAQREVKISEKLTQNNSKLILNIALNYGGRLEIANAAKQIAFLAVQKKIDIEQIDEELFSQYLLTSGQPDPDLLIRPSGEVRLSNFLLWQTAYTELIVLDTLWPDFTKEHLIKALIEYQSRERRFGGIGK
jgi:undecaprenyl diphosphate synthase